MKTKDKTLLTSAPAPVLSSNLPLPEQEQEQEPATAPAPEKAAAAVLWQWAADAAVPVRADILSAWGEYAHRGQIAARDRKGIVDAKALRDLVAAASKRDDKRTIELVRRWAGLQGLKEAAEKAGLVNSKGEAL